MIMLWYCFDHFYTTKIYNGFIGVVLYLFPISIPHIIIKEIYRIEINLRNIDHEKKSEYYNKVFLTKKVLNNFIYTSDSDKDLLNINITLN